MNPIVLVMTRRENRKRIEYDNVIVVERNHILPTYGEVGIDIIIGKESG
jgi:hypothetical protein